MTEHNILDMGHVMFLEMIETFITSLGAATAKGNLMRAALKTAESFPETEFSSLEDFVAAIDDLRNPIARIEGKAVHLGDGLFGLPQCPFAVSIRDFKQVHGSLPASFQNITNEYNRPSTITAKYSVGHGAGVSPFCAIHQPLRSALAVKTKIAGRSFRVVQLGCKSASGAKGLADDLIAQTAFSASRVAEVLDDHMCCYAVVQDGGDM